MQTAIHCVEGGGHLSMDEMAAAVGLIMRGDCSEADAARFLLALRAKGETVVEVAGAALAMRQNMTRIRSSRTGLLDTCGTGGDGSTTFNISTAAALVAAAAGVPVAKHGNLGISSRSGSADALTALGVNIHAAVPVVEACLDELGICFCYAPLLHQAMRHVAAVRKRLGVPTIFNILGPLANPAGAPFQLVGVGRRALQPVISQALTLLGTQRAVVVHGADGLDEVTLADTTHVIETGPDGSREFDWAPGDFGLDPAELGAIKVAGPEESAAMIRSVLDDRPGPARDIVVANAAAALWAAGRDGSPRRCAQLAGEAIQSGAAKDVLARLVERTGGVES